MFCAKPNRYGRFLVMLVIWSFSRPDTSGVWVPTQDILGSVRYDRRIERTPALSPSTQSVIT